MNDSSAAVEDASTANEDAGTPAGRGTVRIERVPGKCGGQPVLAGTRMPVHDIVSYYGLYEGNVSQILDEFPSLTRAHVEAALEYYRTHRLEIDTILAERRADYEELRAAQSGR